jgi:hypothetical protein
MTSSESYGTQCRRVLSIVLLYREDIKRKIENIKIDLNGDCNNRVCGLCAMLLQLLSKELKQFQHLPCSQDEGAQGIRATKGRATRLDFRKQQKKSQQDVPNPTESFTQNCFRFPRWQNKIMVFQPQGILFFRKL